MTGKITGRRKSREDSANPEQRWLTGWSSSLLSWRVLSGAAIVLGAAAIALTGRPGTGFAVGQNLDRPLYALVDFKVADPERTRSDREAVAAAVPSYYERNPKTLTYDRIRADLRRVFDVAANSPSFEQYSSILSEMGSPADLEAYLRFRGLVDMPEGLGRAQFDEWIDHLPLEQEYVIQGSAAELRAPRSSSEYLILESPGSDGQPVTMRVPNSQLVLQGNEKALRGSAADVARRFPSTELRAVVEAAVFRVFKEHPTIVFHADRTKEKMREAESKVPEAVANYEKDKPFLDRGGIGSKQYSLIEAHHQAYLDFLMQRSPEAVRMRRLHQVREAALAVVVMILAGGLVTYTAVHHPRVFRIRSRTLGFGGVVLGALIGAKLSQMAWPGRLDRAFPPFLLATTIFAIVYPRRFALGASMALGLLTTAVGRADLSFLLTACCGGAVTVSMLDEVRSRTRLITAGSVTAVVMALVSLCTNLTGPTISEAVLRQALSLGLIALLSAFVASGILPFIERVFRIATSLTLLEWRDPTKPLLQALAREAPGTYNHSIVLGTLAEAACESIGCNGLLAQVGALYHDIGKIKKPEYFAENQGGGVNRHDKLAPTMSLLIILGHVRDGVELAKDYHVPRALIPFIEEHHGTTVVRYFHQVASDRQPTIASGRHDRDVAEADFRYPGPKPQSRETAVLMVSDAVEGAVRSLAEPTVGRIESVVHQMIQDRLHDGQFDECDITLKELHKVEESLVKSLAGIYHGRLAYPKSRRAREESYASTRVTG